MPWLGSAASNVSAGEYRLGSACVGKAREPEPWTDAAGSMDDGCMEDFPVSLTANMMNEGEAERTFVLEIGNYA